MTPSDPPSSTPRPKRVHLHIGAPKTGTTYLQEVLYRNRAALADQGVLYPGQEAVAHYEAVLDLRGLAFGGYEDPRVEGAWEELAAQAREWDAHSVVVSHELLSGASEEAMARAVTSFGDDAEVHVVYTARDLGRQVPAMWQESVKNGQRLTFEEYLKRLSAPSRRSRAARIFWRQQHVVEVLARWSAHVPDNRLHVVLVPSPGHPSDLLWHRFASVVGIDPDGLDIEVERTNASLPLAEAELLRRVNVELGDALEWPEYGPTVKFWFAEGLLAGRGDGPQAAVPPSMRGWIEEQADAMAEQLAASGWHVVGDLADLRPVLPAAPEAEAAAPQDGAAQGGAAAHQAKPGPNVAPPAEDLLAAATTALAALLVERARERSGHGAGSRPRRDLRQGLEALTRRVRRLRRRWAARQTRAGSTSVSIEVERRLDT